MMFYSTLRRIAREKKELSRAIVDLQEQSDDQKKEIDRLREKLERRSDFFIEREFRLIDRLLTSKVKTYAITDEIRHKERTEEAERETQSATREAYLRDKKKFLLECAIDAGTPNPEEAAAQMFARNQSQYILELEQGA
jgi:exonuclease VII large subunit